MKKLGLALVSLGLSSSIALAQTSGNIASGRVLGNSGATSAPATAQTLTAMFDRAFCATNNSAPARIAGSWVCLGLGTGITTWLTTPSSANLAAAITDETGSGALVFANNPTLVGSSNYADPMTFFDGTSAFRPTSSVNSNNRIFVGPGTAALGAGPFLTVHFQNGTLASPTTTLAGQELGGLQIEAWDGTTFVQTLPLAIVGVATQNFTAANRGAAWLIQGSGANTNTGQNEISIQDGLTAMSAASPNAAPGKGLGTLWAKNGLYAGVAGSTAGKLVFENATSGSITVQPVAGALGSSVLMAPAATGTIALTNSTVSSVTIAAGTSVGVSGTCAITSTGTCTVGLNVSTVTNKLSGDVAMNNTANYFDGPSTAQGTTGTWYASGTVSALDTAGAASIVCKLWDGTTEIASTAQTTASANNMAPFSLSGVITNPAANIRISCRDLSSTSGQMKAVAAGLGNTASTLTVLRIN